MVPGWPYSIVAALETGATSWTALLDAVRLAPDADVAAVTAGQLRGLVNRLITTGQWREGDPDATEADLDRCWQAFLRRFDIEHTFRLFKQTLGWTVPQVRSPAAADRWTWLVIAGYTQLRLSRPLALDVRRPGENRYRRIG